MMLTAWYAPDARQDIYECAEYFESQDNVAVADRFREAIQKTVKMLCGNPELGERFRRDLTGTIRRQCILEFTDYTCGSLGITTVRAGESCRTGT